MADNKTNNKPKHEKPKAIENKTVTQQTNNKAVEIKTGNDFDNFIKNPIVIISGFVAVVILFILSLLIINALVNRNNNNSNNNQVSQDLGDNNSNSDNTSDSNVNGEEEENNENESISDEIDSGSIDADDSSDSSGRVSSINSNEVLTTGHTRAAYAKAQAIKEAIESSGQWQATDYVPGDIPASPYTVQLGDTLWEIAEGFYGDPYQWVVIRDLNASQIGLLPSGEQALIFPGQVFTLR
jgi:hypothetical protein